MCFVMKTDNDSLTELCFSSDAGNNATSGSSGSDSAAGCDAAHPALYFFVVARLLNGMGNSGTTVLSVAYIDENISKTKSPLYIGRPSNNDRHWYRHHF